MLALTATTVGYLVLVIRTIVLLTTLLGICDRRESQGSQCQCEEILRQQLHHDIPQPHRLSRKHQARRASAVPCTDVWPLQGCLRQALIVYVLNHFPVLTRCVYPVVRPKTLQVHVQGSGGSSMWLPCLSIRCPLQISRVAPNVSCARDLHAREIFVRARSSCVRDLRARSTSMHAIFVCARPPWRDPCTRARASCSIHVAHGLHIPHPVHHLRIVHVHLICSRHVYASSPIRYVDYIISYLGLHTVFTQLLVLLTLPPYSAQYASRYTI